MDVTPNPGSTANSVWNGNPTRGTQNDLEIGIAPSVLTHRIVGSFSYRKEYLKHLATTVSLFYEGASQGRFSYVVGGDLNNDGNSNVDLMYIPRTASELTFVNATYGGVTYTPAQQSAAFDAFVNQDSYLSKRRGQYAERNGAQLPWYNRLDFKFVQDIFTSVKGSKNTLQFTADIFNFLNLLNRDWGIRKIVIQNQPLVFAGYNTSGVPTYRMNQFNNQLLTTTYRDNISTGSTWSMQIGLRYMFN